jgi:hypothetical protein
VRFRQFGGGFLEAAGAGAGFGDALFAFLVDRGTEAHSDRLALPRAALVHAPHRRHVAVITALGDTDVASIGKIGCREISRGLNSLVSSESSDILWRKSNPERV